MTARSSDPRRNWLWIGVICGVAGTLAICASVSAVATPADPCQSVYKKNSISNLKKYVKCREDRQDAALKRIEAELKRQRNSNGLPSATPSVSPSASPTHNESPPAHPNATNTGWKHTGITLKAVKVGDSAPGWTAGTVGGTPILYVTAAGTVLDGLDIPMCVKVMANDVTIKRSRIACASAYTVNVSDPPTYYTGLNMSDVEIDGLGSLARGIAIMASGGATLTRLDIHGFESSGPRLASNSTIQDSWIHDFVCNAGDHSAGTSANDGGTGIKILRNNIDINASPNVCASAAIAVYPDFGNYDGVQIIGNRVSGGAYCIYTAQNQGAKNVRVERNVFVRTPTRPQCGVYGPVAQSQSGNGNTFLENTWDDGSPVG